MSIDWDYVKRSGLFYENKWHFLFSSRKDKCLAKPQSVLCFCWSPTVLVTVFPQFEYNSPHCQFYLITNFILVKCVKYCFVWQHFNTKLTTNTTTIHVDKNLFLGDYKSWSFKWKYFRFAWNTFHWKLQNCIHFNIFIYVSVLFPKQRKWFLSQ